MAINRKFAEEIGFESVNALLLKHPPSLIADAIEQHSVYTWDGLGRYIEARDDANKGWVYRFDENSQAYKMRHLGDEELPDRRTQSRVLALLENFNTYWEKAEESGLPLETSNTVTIRIPKGQIHTLPLETLHTQETAKTYAIIVPWELREELATFGWASDDRPDWEAIQLGVETQPIKTAKKTFQVNSTEPLAPKNPLTEDPFSVFKDMDNLAPEDLRLTFLADKYIEISARDKKRQVHLSVAKLFDGKAKRLTKQGLLLQGMARGTLVPKTELKGKHISLIRKKVFRELLGLQPDPFHPKKNNWKPRFTIAEELDRAGEREKRKAKHVPHYDTNSDHGVTYQPQDDPNEYSFEDEEDEAGKFIKRFS